MNYLISYEEAGVRFLQDFQQLPVFSKGVNFRDMCNKRVHELRAIADMQYYIDYINVYTPVCEFKN